MAEREVTGQSIFLFIDAAGGTDYDTLVCLTTKSLNRTTDTINSSTQCGSSSSPGSKSSDVSFEGNQMVDVDTGRITGSDLHDLWDDQTIFSWKIAPATLDADSVSYTGMGYITSLSDTYGEGASTFSGTISVSGNITKTIGTS